VQSTAARHLALGLVLGVASASACSSSAETPGVSSAGQTSSAGTSQAVPAGGTSVGPTGGGSNTVGGTSSTGGAAGASRGGAPSAGTSNQSAGDASGGAPDEPSGDYWKPQAGLTWQWQLSEDVGTPLDVDVYDIDWEVDRAVVDKLHAAGIKVICYVSVGSWEDFRPDAKDFPAAVIGNDYAGWPGEKYVDIRADALRAVMSARFDTCKSKGFDAIEPDNMDVFELGSDSGFPLTEKDGIAYANWLATSAHSRGMGIGQKNASSITGSIASTYDWALTESCYSDGNWCGDVKAYASANKPVFMCEYEAKSFSAACGAWKPKSYSPILKGLDLDAPVTFCP
jgi:hypothetical protein